MHRLLRDDSLAAVCGIGQSLSASEGISAGVDWELASWTSRYSEIVPQTLALQLKALRASLPQVIEFDNSQARLPLESVDIDAEKEEFEVSDDVASITGSGLKEILEECPGIVNGRAVRLLRVVSDADGISAKITLQPVRYFDHLRTNMQMDRTLPGGKTLREIVHPGGALEPLETSKLANPLGVDVLLFTRTGDLIVQKRSMGMSVRPGALAPSVSGGFLWQDIAEPGTTTLADVPVWREAVEELGIAREALRDIVFLGVTRELARGGQPEAFFAGVVDATRDGIKAAWRTADDAWESSELRFYPIGMRAVTRLESAQEFAELRAIVADFNQLVLNEASVTLQANVALWLSWKESEALRPDAAPSARMP